MGGMPCHEEAVLEGFDDAQVTVNGHAQQREDQVCAQKYTCETVDLYRIEENSIRNFDLRLLFFCGLVVSQVNQITGHSSKSPLKRGRKTFLNISFISYIHVFGFITYAN